MKHLAWCYLAVMILIIFTACTSKKDANHALTSAGYTNIKTNGYGWFACSDDDFYRTKFIATNVRGKVVTGTVCSGLIFKISTMRF